MSHGSLWVLGMMEVLLIRRIGAFEMRTRASSTLRRARWGSNCICTDIIDWSGSMIPLGLFLTFLGRLIDENVICRVYTLARSLWRFEL